MDWLDALAPSLQIPAGVASGGDEVKAAYYNAVSEYLKCVAMERAAALRRQEIALAAAVSDVSSAMNSNDETSATSSISMSSSASRRRRRARNVKAAVEKGVYLQAGKCYLRMFRHGRRAEIEERLGSYPALREVAREAAEDVVDDLDPVTVVPAEDGGWHLSFKGDGVPVPVFFSALARRYRTGKGMVGSLWVGIASDVDVRPDDVLGGRAGIAAAVYDDLVRIRAQWGRGECRYVNGDLDECAAMLSSGAVSESQISPRMKELGSSGLGFCRAYVRASSPVMVMEDGTLGGMPGWKERRLSAAHMSDVLGRLPSFRSAVRASDSSSMLVEASAFLVLLGILLYTTDGERKAVRVMDKLCFTYVGSHEYRMAMECAKSR